MTEWQDIIDACWPPERMEQHGPWTHRISPGAGGRVNAISGSAPEAIAQAEQTALSLNQRPSFLIFKEGGPLDTALADRGYTVEDAVTLWQTDVAPLTPEPMSHATAFTIWPPLQIMREIWAAGGHVCAARQAVMARAARPAGVLGRVDDRAAGTAFVAAHEDTAMLSAVEVLEQHRRKGVAGNILKAAAHWAKDQGCTRIALVAARNNLPANAAYASHGMEIAAQYHYRRAPESR